MRIPRKVFPFLLVLLWVNPVLGGMVITDDFNPRESSLWSNERGSWVALNGLYGAQQPNNSPLTYTSLPIPLTDFVLEGDVIGVSDGGIWLRSNFRNGKASGVLLITGGYGRSGTGLYWHIVHNDTVSPVMQPRAGFFAQRQNIHLRVEVKGNTYSAFINGSPTPATTLTTGDFSSGYTGLYAFSGQKFANIRIEVGGPAVPVPTGRDYTSVRPRDASGQEGQLEELVVPNTRPEKVLSRNVLEAGKEYIIEASGTWDDWGNTLHGVDAVWCFAEWRCGRQGEAWNQLRIDGKGMTEIAGQTIPYNPEHIYRIRYRGQGKRVELYSSDALTSWGDNLGALTVRIYASGAAAEAGQETGRAYTGVRPRIPPASTDLTGRWKGNDGGNYFLRQVGKEVWWYGQSGDGGASWTNVFNGRVEGNQVVGQWADVPRGRIMNSGEISLQIVAPNYLRAINRTGGFGGSEWTR